MSGRAGKDMYTDLLCSALGVPARVVHCGEEGLGLSGKSHLGSAVPTGSNECDYYGGVCWVIILTLQSGGCDTCSSSRYDIPGHRCPDRIFRVFGRVVIFSFE